MKNYSSKKVRGGKVAYRTPSRFIANKTVSAPKPTYRAWHLAARLDRKTAKGKE